MQGRKRRRGKQLNREWTNELRAQEQCHSRAPSEDDIHKLAFLNNDHLLSLFPPVLLRQPVPAPIACEQLFGEKFLSCYLLHGLGGRIRTGNWYVQGEAQ